MYCGLHIWRKKTITCFFQSKILNSLKPKPLKIITIDYLCNTQIWLPNKSHLVICNLTTKKVNSMYLLEQSCSPPWEEIALIKLLCARSTQLRDYILQSRETIHRPSRPTLCLKADLLCICFVYSHKVLFPKFHFSTNS